LVNGPPFGEQHLKPFESVYGEKANGTSATADELDVLALLIEKYEQEMFPIDPPSPVEAIKFRMEQQGLIKKDLTPYIGSAPKVTEVLNGTRNLSINMIRKLHQGLGISLDILIKEPAHLRTNDKETNQYAVWAWQVRILKKAQDVTPAKKYVKHTVDLAWMRKLAQLSWSEQGPVLAKEYLYKYGIHLIIEPHLPKTYLDGAVCLTHKGNPRCCTDT
jgi:antitoxin component HigA of HigAB toxin-antitoxin module